MRATLAWAALVAVVLVGSARLAHADDPPDSFRYTTVAGDTCKGIARRFYGDPERTDLIHQLNKGMGPPPHNLRPGTILFLPKLKAAPVDTGPDAKLTGKNGTVDARSPVEEAWKAAVRGMDLFRAWRVGSHEKSTADVTFKDSSELHMRENTVVVIYGGAETKVRKQTYEAHLEKGTLGAHLGEISGGGAATASPGLLVTTESSDAELTSGRSVVSVDDAATTRVANHEGKSARVWGKTAKGGERSKSVDVHAGMGTKVEKGKDPTPPKPLPPAPGWGRTDPRTIPSVEGASAVELTWGAVGEAAKYRLSIAGQPDGSDVQQTTDLPSSATRFELLGLPVGTYYVTIAAVDADGFEGKPSAPVQVTVVGVQMNRPGGVGAAGGTGAGAGAGAATGPARPPSQVPIGTEIVAPTGGSCAVAGGSSGPSIRLGALGHASVACTAPGGKAIEPLELEVTAPSIRLRALDGGDVPALVRDQPTILVFDIPEELAGKAKIVAPATVEVEPATHPARGQLQVFVRALPGAPAQVTFKLLVGDAPAPVFEKEVRVVDPVAPPPPVAVAPPPKPRAYIGELSLTGGADLYSSDAAFDGTLVPDHAFRAVGSVAFNLGSYFALEGALTAGQATLVGQPSMAANGPTSGASVSGGKMIGGRAMALVQVRLGPIRPYVTGGIGFLNLSSGDTSGGNRGVTYAGGGLKLDLTSSFGLRASALEGFFLGTGKVTSMDLGIWWSF